MPGLVRMQILFTEEQARRLRQVAKQRGETISAVVREMVEEALAERARRKEEIFRQLDESARWLAEHAPEAMHTPEDLDAIREERLDELMPDVRG